MEVLRSWFKRRFSDPQIIILALLLLVGFGIVLALGGILAPFFAAVIIAYLLEGVIVRLQRVGVPRALGVGLVFLLFLAALVFLVFGLVPLLSRQVTQFVQQVPTYFSNFQTLLLELPEKYPQIDEAQVRTFISSLTAEVTAIGQRIVATSLSSVAGAIAVIVFLVLVPVLVFFLMKDKNKIINWFKRYLPKDRHLAERVWHDVDNQIGNYVRGKTAEILIVGSVTYLTFQILGLQYSILLATLVGFSVLIPFIGAAVVTVPIALVAFFQFGWGGDFAWVIIAYSIIQLLDGNALVPLLFSEVVNLHPVAIIVAVLLFGGIWGFWGVFFAIPLATLVQAVLSALPDDRRHGDNAPDDSDASDEQVLSETPA